MASFFWVAVHATDGFQWLSRQSGLVGLEATGGVCIERRGSDTHTGGHIFRFLAGPFSSIVSA